MPKKTHGVGRPSILRDAGLRWIFILTRNLPVMAAFYGEILGLEATYQEPGRFAFFRTGGNGPVIALYPGRRGRSGKNPSWFVVFDVPDLEEVAASLSGKGLTVGPIEPVPFGRMFQFPDPEGNLIQIHQSDR